MSAPTANAGTGQRRREDSGSASYGRQAACRVPRRRPGVQLRDRRDGAVCIYIRPSPRPPDAAAMLDPMTDLGRNYDVLVVGGGNAALCAASPRAGRGASRADRRIGAEGTSAAATAGTRATSARMHDGPTDVLTDAYPEEEFWQDLLQGHRRADRRAARAPDDPRIRHLAPWMVAARRPLAAVARRHAASLAHQRVLPRRRQGAGQRLLPHRRSARRRGRLRLRGRATSTSATAGSVRQRSCASGAQHEIRREGHGRRLRRLRGEPRLAEATPGDPRPTTSSSAARRTTWGRVLRAAARPGREVDRRPDAVPRGGGRRARAEVRRRHRHPPRLRAVRDRRQPARDSASTTKARTSGPSATRSGAARRRPARPDRLLDHRRKGRSASSCRRCTRRSKAGSIRELARALELDPAALEETVDEFNAAVRPGHLRPRDARRLRHRGPRAAEDPLGAADRHAALLRLPAAARHHLHLPRRRR